jgi:hypothetical protein
MWGVASGQNGAKTSHFALLGHYRRAIKNLPAIFQTVSLGTWVNKAEVSRPRDPNKVAVTVAVRRDSSYTANLRSCREGKVKS